MAKDKTNKSFWDRIAKIYTNFMSKNNEAYDDICYHIDLYSDKNKNVLELACGTGQITYRMAEKFKLWVATDYSENMVNKTKKRNEDFNCDSLDFSVQDATSLTYENDTFDIVVIANALHIMPDPDKALDEIHRVLKNGGVLFAPTFVYEPGYSKMLIWLMERAGFKTYHKWNKNQFVNFIREKNFNVIGNTLIEGKPLFECMLIAKK